MKYIVFTYEGSGIPVARKLFQEGADVTVGMVQDGESELFLPKDSSESVKRRLSLGDGMIEKVPAKYLLKAMSRIENKDHFWIHFDFNTLWPYAQAARRMGFKYGNFPTKEDHSLEEDRAKAKELVEKYYPQVKVGKCEEFSKIEEGIDFLNDQGAEDLWVLKGSDETAKTVAPKTNNPAFARNILIDALKHDKKEYESGSGFILEQKIRDMHEITPQMYLWNGKPIMTNVNIELKYVGAGNEGIQCGCGGSVVIHTDLDDPINEISFPQEILDQYKNDVGLRLLDISLFEKEKEFYFGEFCPNRFGYDSSYVEMEMSGERLQDYFEKIREGDNPIIKKFGASVRSYNLGREDKVDKHIAEKNLRVQWDQEFEKRMWLMDIKKNADDQFVTCGYTWDLNVFTGASNDFIRAVDLAYEASEHCFVEKSILRPKFDLMSTDYQDSILNRYRALNGSAFTAEEV